jgi:hypothetical protein
VFDEESDDIICIVKEEKLNFKVFRSSNLQGKIPDYKTKSNKISLCMPLSLVILHGKEPLAEVHYKPRSLLNVFKWSNFWYTQQEMTIYLIEY